MRRDEFNWLISELRALSGNLGTLAGHGEEPLLLAIDQGGHASRAIAFDVTGREVAVAFAPLSTYRSGADRVEHQASEVLESIRIAIADLCQSLGPDSNRIAVAGLAAQRSSIVCWDRRSLEALSPVLSWQDRRNAKWLESWRQHETDIWRMTGLKLSPHYGVSKLRWCLDELPAVRDASSRGLLAMGPLAAWLLGNLLEEKPFVVDSANAARTLLWDISLSQWSPRLLDLAGIPVSLLPRCVPNRYAYGALPLPGRTVPLVVCTGDQSAVPFAHGRPDGHTIYLNMGTGAFLQCPLDSDSGPSPLLRSVLWSEEETRSFALEGTVNGAGSALDWLDDQTGLDDHRAAHSLTRDKIANLSIPIFLNGVSGVGSPFWLPHLESRFLEAKVATDELGKVTAVIESIAFLVAANVAQMQRVCPGLTRILAGGGLSQSDYLCDCIADLTGMLFERSSLREATATGLAFLVAGQPAGWAPAAEFRRFSPKDNPLLQERHRRWQQAMKDAVSSR